jgi:hypothetical protein
MQEAKLWGWRYRRERWAALAGAVLLTGALPIAIGQGYLRHNEYLLPGLGLLAVLLYIGFFLTTEFSKMCIARLYSECGKVGNFALYGVFASLCVLVGGALASSEMVLIVKSREHIAGILAEGQKPISKKELSGAARSVFVDRLRVHAGQRDRVEFACARWSESACALAGAYLKAFSEASWPLQSETVRRIELELPMSGVVMVSRSQAPPGTRLPPHMGWWTKMDNSEITLWAAFQQMGIALQQSSDERLATDALILYFGPEEEH